MGELSGIQYEIHPNRHMAPSCTPPKTIPDGTETIPSNKNLDYCAVRCMGASDCTGFHHKPDSKQCQFCTDSFSGASAYYMNKNDLYLLNEERPDCVEDC